MVGSLSLSCLCCPSRLVKHFFPHYFSSFVPIAQRAGQEAVLGRLSLSMCRWEIYCYKIYDILMENVAILDSLMIELGSGGGGGA